MSIVKVRNTKERIKDRVLVLLSTYNGEKYIREQLDSLLKQTMPVYILIRDDGSSDSTPAIIHEYMEKHENIKLMEGKNLGFAGSFSALVSNELVDEYEWAAFCDQDDVWLPEKLTAAVKMIQKDYDPEVPTLYCSNLTVTDEKLNKIALAFPPDSPKKLHPLLSHFLGCTYVFNHASAVLYRYGINDSIYGHDIMMHSVCYYFGRVYIDDNSYILYRRHSTNAGDFAMPKGIFQGAKDVLSEIFHPKKRYWVKHFRGFEKAYSKYLTNNEKKFLQIFINHETSLIYRLIIFFDPRFNTNNFKETLAFKVRALINRMY